MTNDTVDERMVGDNLRVTVHYDTDADQDTALDYSRLTVIRGWHRRTVIGDGPNIDSESYGGWDDMLASVVTEYDAVMVAPLYWYEHSGQTCRMGSPFTVGTGNHDAELARFRSECMDTGGWDSGVAGLVIVPRASQQEVGTPDDLLAKVAEGEVETYAAWLEGRVYGYTVELLTECDHGDEHPDTLDACWGFIGEAEYAMEEGLSFVGWHVANVFRMIA